jgi:hypothetical protein
MLQDLLLQGTQGNVYDALCDKFNDLVNRMRAIKRQDIAESNVPALMRLGSCEHWTPARAAHVYGLSMLCSKCGRCRTMERAWMPAEECMCNKVDVLPVWLCSLCAQKQGGCLQILVEDVTSKALEPGRKRKR